MKNIIEMQNVSKHYGEVAVVENISFTVEKGKIYGFIGPNGAGKTTTIKMILGMTDSSNNGRIVVLDKLMPQDRIEILRKVGAIVESPAYYGDLNAYDNMKIITLIKRADENQIEELLGVVGLNNVGKKKVKDFSLGMKQRLAIAQALVGNPELIILDEPTNGLDPVGIHEIRELLLNLKKQGLSIFLSSHILTEIEQITDEIIVIEKGKILFAGPSLNLINQYGVENLEAAYLLLTKNVKEGI